MDSKHFTVDDKALKVRAKMTQIQLEALAYRLNKKLLLEELFEITYYRKYKRSSKNDIHVIKRWIVNGWNTEYILRSNAVELKGDILRASLHWAFPQAYYSVFAITMAFFKLTGLTEDSHSGVITKIGKMMQEGKYPKSMSFYASGISKNISFNNINNHSLPNSLFFTPKPEIIDAQICQFLNSTRKNDLKERKKTMDFKRKDNKKKKNLTCNEWNKVSESLGVTSIFSLLYRKRIKSNYHDIDTYLCPEVHPDVVYQSLIQIVSLLNMVHEAYIIKGIGLKKFGEFMNDLFPDLKDTISRRVLAIHK